MGREGYSNRIFFLTDLEVTAEDGRKFKDGVLSNSSRSLWSTVVGVGLDLTQVLHDHLNNFVSKLTLMSGCNQVN